MSRIAFLGLGIMGSRMAANLVAAGHELTVWNRTAAVSGRFASEHGARVARTPREASAGAEFVLSMVVDGDQVQAILLGDDGAVDGADAGAVFLDCSTIGPAPAQRIGAGLEARGMRFLDAPVTGSSPRAQEGTLTFMVGGAQDAFDRAEPILAGMGSLIVHCGAVGQGQLVKVINNAMAAANAATLAQALVVGAAAGADLDALTRVAGAGSGGSVMLDLKAGPMRRHDYTPLFKLDHMLKDVRLCLAQAQASGVRFPIAEQTDAILADAAQLGFGEQDFAALIEPVQRDSGVRL